MTFLRDSGLAKVRAGHHHAKGNQQGDVHRIVADRIRQGIYRNAIRAPSGAVAGCHAASARSPAKLRRIMWPPHDGTRGGMGLDVFGRRTASSRRDQAHAVETNLIDPAEVRSAVDRVFSRLQAKNRDVALLVPDPSFASSCCTSMYFRAQPEEAFPLLRWRLKKSVPFEADETVISYMRQAPREDGVDIVTGLARLRIVREYEQSLVESVGMSPGVVMSSTLAAFPVCPIAGRAAGARCRQEPDDCHRSRGILCGYRCVELPADARHVTPQDFAR